MKLQDAIFNWLQIKLVAEARTDDNAAKETLEFFDQILKEDHHILEIKITSRDDSSIMIEYETESETKKQAIDRERAEQLLESINENPKYNQC